MAQITANGDYGPYNWGRHGGGTLVTSGTFDSATVKLQYSLDGGLTKTDYPNVSQTAPGVTPFAISQTVDLYVNVAGGGGSLDFFMQLNETEGAMDSGGSSAIISKLQEVADNTDTLEAGVLDNGPAGTTTTTILQGVSLGSAQTLAAAPGASLTAQLRDLLISVDTDVEVSIYSTSGTIFAGNFKASNGTIQMTPRQGFSAAGTNEAVSIICTATTPTATANITVNSVSV